MTENQMKEYNLNWNPDFWIWRTRRFLDTKGFQVSPSRFTCKKQQRFLRFNFNTDNSPSTRGAKFTIHHWKLPFVFHKQKTGA